MTFTYIPPHARFNPRNSSSAARLPLLCSAATPNRAAYQHSSTPAIPSSLPSSSPSLASASPIPPLSTPPTPPTPPISSAPPPPPPSTSTPRTPTSSSSYPRRHRHPNPDKHTYAILRASQAGSVPRLHQALTAARADGYRLNTVNFVQICECYIRARRPEDVFNIMDEMRSLRLPPTSAILRTACKAALAMPPSRRGKAVDLVMNVLNWTRQSNLKFQRPCVQTWNYVIFTLLHHHAVDHAISLLLFMLAEGKEQNKFNDDDDTDPSEYRNIPLPDSCSFNRCMTALGKNHKLISVLELFGKMLVCSSVQPDVYTFNAILNAAAVYKRPLPASLPKSTSMPSSTSDTSTLSISDRQNDDVHSIAVSTMTASCNLHPYCNNNLSFVHALRACMQRHGVKPDVLTETLILRVLSRNPSTSSSSASDGGDKILRSSIRSYVHDILNGPLSPSLDKTYFDAALTASGLVSDVNLTSDVLNEMMLHRRIRPDVYTVRALLVGARASHDVSLTNFILDVSDALGIRGDTHAYTTALTACVSQPGMTQKILERARRADVQLSAPLMNAAISSCGDDLQAALSLWRRIRIEADKATRALTTSRMVYDSLFRVCGRAASPSDALRLWYAAKNAGHIIPYTSESRSVCKAFIRGLDECEHSGPQEIKRHLLKRQYFKLLQTECGLEDGESQSFEWPVERIRIRW